MPDGSIDTVVRGTFESVHLFSNVYLILSHALTRDDRDREDGFARKKLEGFARSGPRTAIARKRRTSFHRVQKGLLIEARGFSLLRSGCRCMIESVSCRSSKRYKWPDCSSSDRGSFLSTDRANCEKTRACYTRTNANTL